MCAALVKAGLFDTWQDAFEKGIQPQRSVCKLNKRMREALQKWQDIYVDKKEQNVWIGSTFYRGKVGALTTKTHLPTNKDYSMLKI